MRLPAVPLALALWASPPWAGAASAGTSSQAPPGGAPQDAEALRQATQKALRRAQDIVAVAARQSNEAEEAKANAEIALEETSHAEVKAAKELQKAREAQRTVRGRVRRAEASSAAGKLRQQLKETEDREAKEMAAAREYASLASMKQDQLRARAEGAEGRLHEALEALQREKLSHGDERMLTGGFVSASAVALLLYAMFARLRRQAENHTSLIATLSFEREQSLGKIRQLTEALLQVVPAKDSANGAGGVPPTVDSPVGVALAAANGASTPSAPPPAAATQPHPPPPLTAAVAPPRGAPAALPGTPKASRPSPKHRLGGGPGAPDAPAP